MKRNLFFLVIFLLFASHCFGQSADTVSELIKTDKVTYGQAAYMSAVSIGLANDDTSFEQAFSILQANGSIKDSALINDPIPLSHLAFIVMRTWKIKPCMMYALFPSPHYALRSLKASGLVYSSFDPKKTSTGHEVLDIFSKCIDTYESYSAAEASNLRVYK